MVFFTACESKEGNYFWDQKQNFITLDLLQFYEKVMYRGISCQFSSATFPYREIPTSE